MKKFISLGLVALITATSLAGCGGKDELDELNNISALNVESSVTDNYSLSWADEQDMIYAQISDRQLLDLSSLSACSDNEIQQVRNYMDLVDNQLIGMIDVNNYTDESSKLAVNGLVEDNAVIDSKLTDYLLSFMENTPYYWQRTKTTIRGIDSRSRSIVVDVEYKTIDFEKTIASDSAIVRGDPNYNRLCESRYNKWISILDTRKNNPDDINLPRLEKSFNKNWGDPEEIIEAQRNYSNTIDIYLTGNQKTYSGMVDSDYEKTKGTMTVRYVLVPNYVLGVNLGVVCQHMYITEYNIDDDFTQSFETFTEEGYQTVTDNVYSLIYSYFTCIDESDYEGLYSLTTSFEGLDKHYEDIFESTYQKHQGYSVSLFDITGTHISCGVTISTKERAKNSNMTLPVYTDRYYMELELVDDVLKVNNMVLVSRKLEGEPAISDEEVDKTGFSATIELDNDDKIAIEKLICDFSALQLNTDTTSDSFTDIVDTSISTNQLSSLKSNMTSLSGVKKVVFLQNYQQGTTNYASVRCKELYQDKDNAIVEAVTTYEFILKGGKWYIYNYDVNSSVHLDTTNLQTTGSLCLVSPGEVISYTSQVKSTVATNTEEVSDIAVSFEHESYTPMLKNGVVEQGLVLYDNGTVTDEMLGKVLSLGKSDITANDFYDTIDTLGYTGGTDISKRVENITLNVTAIYYNKIESRYKNKLEFNTVVTEASDEIGSLISELEALSNEADEDTEGDITRVSDMLSGLNMLLKD